MSNDIFGPPENSRLVTIAAHVDSGKTTLADNLIEHNGIISERAAGTLRYLDSDPEEQRRGITMRSSAIGLRYQYTAKPNDEATRMIVHLIDSPGHTDFCREVASSMGVADCGLLVLDAVEGMTARFQQVLRETERNSLIPILVLNKLDRLQSELFLSPTEAYLRLRSLLETVNAACAAMVASVMEHRNEEPERREELEDIWTFEPAKGNVIFACAYYGWGFTVPMLSRTLFRNRVIPVKPLVLRQYLFGDYKRKGEQENTKVVVWKQSSNEIPLFAEYALQPIWDICEGIQKAAAVSNGKALRIKDMGDSFQSRLPPNVDMEAILAKHGTSSESTLRATLRRYCNLADATLHAVCEYAPSPKDRALGKVPCDIEGPTKAYVCKLLFTDASNMQDSALDKRLQGDLVVLGLTRVLSGQLKTGQEYCCIGDSGSRRTVCVRIYILMGSSFVNVDSVPAGHLCAVFGLEGADAKTFTLADDPDSPPIRGIEQHIRPLVKVHIEPESTADAEYLEHGLEKLRMADTSVEVSATDKGERLLACLGELHLDQCIVDLEKLYCGKEGIKLKISDPIVEFAETTEWFETESNYESFYSSRTPELRQTTVPPYKDEEGIALARHGRFRAVLPSQAAAIHLRVVPLSDSIFTAITSESESIESISDDVANDLTKLGLALNCVEDLKAKDILEVLRSNVCSTEKNGNILVQYSGLRTGSLVKGVVCGSVYTVKDERSVEVEYDCNTPHSAPGQPEFQDLKSKILSSGIARDIATGNIEECQSDAIAVWKNSLSGSLAAGFALALRSGPMCEEPIRRTLVVLEGVEIALEKTEGQYRCPRQLVGGMVVSALRTGIRCALLSRPMRLMEAYLRLTLHASLTGLGPLYQVLGKRRGKVIEDSMVDGTDLLMITAIVPQAEAFGLTPELMAKTSGEVTVPEMLFSHWETLNVDPFWVPTSEEEREDFGELQNAGDSSTGLDNTALFYIRNVRKRKGLTVDSARTVANAEKQKTLKNK